MSVPWTEERETWLRDLVASEQKPSATQIAETMGVTRNTVIGKVRRLGLQLPNPQSVHNVPRKSAPHRRINHLTRMMWGDKIPDSINYVSAAPPVVQQHRAVGLLDLQFFHCRWPTDRRGVDGLMMFCGAPAHTGPYCAGHAFMAYRTKDELRRDAIAERKAREAQAA